MKTTTHHLARPLLVALLLGAAALLAGCASPSYTITEAGHANAAKDNLAPPRAEDFPDVGKAVWKQGAFPSLEALRAMRTGMGKDQVRELLSYPHFSEGLFGVREWNYIFHFRTGAGPEFVTCQYMVRFNGDVLTNGMYWKNPDCALLVNPPVVKPIPPPPPAPPPVVMPVPQPMAPQKITLGADGLFRFNGSTGADLLPEGRRKIEALAVEVKRNFLTLGYVLITGHTDRIGTSSYNERLSLARANTVRDLLAQQGIDRAKIRTAGMGERAPVVTNCPGNHPTPSLVSCLQPNRRVEIEVSGDR